MIGLLIVAAAVAGWWTWRTRRAQAARFGDVAALVAALVGLRFLIRGEMVEAAVALGGAGWWLWRRRTPRPDPDVMSREQASRLLDVPIDASPETIRAAHRRLVSRVHPDAGGSAPLAAQVNAARDALLGHPHS